MSTVRICDRCGEKIDPGLFGKQGRSAYYLIKQEGSEHLAECAFCKTIYYAPLYEMVKPTPRFPRRHKRGGGERNREGRE